MKMTRRKTIAAIAVLTLAGSLLVVVVTALRAGEAENQAVQTVEGLGGEIRRDNSLVGKLTGKPVLGVKLGTSGATDADLKKLTALKSLEWLDLSSTQVTDAGLMELAALDFLRTLELGRTQVTDAGLKELAGLKSLRILLLDSTKVTDAGLKELAALKTLERLDLINTSVTDAGLKELAALKSLRQLFVGHTQVTQAGIAELGNALPKCQVDSSSDKYFDIILYAP